MPPLPTDALPIPGQLRQRRARAAEPRFESIRSVVLVSVAAAARISAGGEHHVEVRVLAVVRVIARAHDEQLRVAG